MAIKGFEILLWFLIIPLAAGNLPVFETGKEKDWFVRMADALICGYVLLFAVFELLALPLIFTRQSFAVLKYSYEILACVLALAGVIFAWKNKKNRADGAERKKSLSRKKIPAAMWLAFLLVAIQMGAYVFGMATDLDDAFYVATATTTLETNGMFTYDAYTGMLASYLPARYVFAPFPILLAFYSDMVHMHAAVVAHTVEPVFFLLISGVRHGYYAGTDHAGAYDTFVCGERQKLGKHKKSSDMLPAECYLCGGICDHTLEERVES